MAALVDTNILVYRFDNRFPEKQKIATDILRRGILENSVRVPHQAIVEFIAAVTRPVRGHVILPLIDALREAEEFLLQFTVLYPNEAIVRNAIRDVRRTSSVGSTRTFGRMQNITAFRKSSRKISSMNGFTGPSGQ